MRTSTRPTLFGLLLLTAVSAGLMLGCESAAEREEGKPKNNPVAKEKK